MIIKQGYGTGEGPIILQGYGRRPDFTPIPIPTKKVTITVTKHPHDIVSERLDYTIVTRSKSRKVIDL